jgi:2-dehydropantoate 2-reductase
VAVAQARRIGVDEAHIRAAVEHAFAEHRTHKPSMLQDRLAGRSMEIITITGAVAAASEGAGVETPVTTTLTALLLALDDKRAGALPAP